MIVSIHQPDYVPYLGYFYKIYRADTFVFLDNVQFSSGNMHHWNKILLEGKETRLKIPVEYHFGDMLTKVRCKYELDWVDKHLSLIENAYNKCSYFNEIYPEIEQLLRKQYNSLAEMNIELNTKIASMLGIETKFVLASQLGETTKKEELVIDICKNLGADCYLSGNGARVYQDEEHFAARGLKLSYTDYEIKEYLQQSDSFVPNLSVIDYLMNCGKTNPFE